VNLKVAKLCNHQKVASKTSGQQLEKTLEKITELTQNLKKLKREKDKKISEGKSTQGINKKILSLQQKIKNLKNKKSLQSESKTLSAGTSKTNYIDPRITIAFLKTHQIFDGIDKFFSKTHQNQFTWAMSVEETFKF
jgi:DNA topoisomerase I